MDLNNAHKGLFVIDEAPQGYVSTLRYTGVRPRYADAFGISIQKWEALRDACLQGMLVDDGGVSTCGLCMLYFYGTSEECEDCPVREEGYPGCIDTPARDYPAAIKAGSLDDALRAAERELAFLHLLFSRRPPPETP